MKRILSAACALSLATSAHAAAIVGLFNTGTDAAGLAIVGGNGVADPHYVIQSSTSAGFAGQQAVTFQCCYVANDANSRWISLNASGGPGGNTSVYRTTFSLAGLNPATAAISGSWGADNVGTIFLNGVNTGITITNVFSSLVGFSITSGFVAGINTLDFRVVDEGAPGALRVDDLVGTANVAVTGAVPEPASWLMMILGFGIAGTAMRQRRGKPVLI